MDKAPLTLEEQRFAAEHYKLIFKFLEESSLGEDEYFDIVVFGFLSAVRRYCSDTGLQRYAFSTIAWRNMRRCVSDHIRAQLRKKRKAVTVSLDSLVAEGGGYISPGRPYLHSDTLGRLETELLMQELAIHLSNVEMDIIRMRVAGYNLHEIARVKKMSVKSVSDLLAGLLDVVRGVCHGQI